MIKVILFFVVDIVLKFCAMWTVCDIYNHYKNKGE